MSKNPLDVVGIGNAIVDILAQTDDELLQDLNLPKGHMQLIDQDAIATYYKAIPSPVKQSGGSAANTIAGVAKFGGKGGFIGRVADDDFGKDFTDEIKDQNIEFHSHPVRGGKPTACCFVMISPDGERTMSTYLGASTELDEGEVNAKMIEGAKILYLEGYLYDAPEAKEAFHKAADIASASNTKTALSLSDSFCVDRHRQDFLNFIKAQVDILFANEEEIKSLYQMDHFADAAEAARADVDLAVLTQGAKGSMIIAGQNTMAVPAASVSKVVDTTGAGDLYAAGFLYGLTQDKPYETCGALAALAAGEIISHIGARPVEDLQKLAKEQGLL